MENISPWSFYLDTSLLVTALIREVQTEKVQVWLAAREPRELMISDWVVTEFSSALSKKLRFGDINAGQRAEALAIFTRLSVDTFTILPVSGAHFRTAARFTDQFTLGVLAGDALHLAICADQGITLCTRDRRLAEAGPALGVKTLLLD